MRRQPKARVNISSVPAEIIDVVLDFLHEDKDSLNSCSLTCKAWVSTSHYHLFDTITLEPSDVISFLDFVDITSSNVAGYVRQLVVRRSVYAMMGHLRPTEAVVRENAEHLATRLSGLEQLKLSVIHWETLPPLIKNLVYRLQKIKHLELYRVNFDTIMPAIELIFGFPALESLSLQGWNLHTKPIGSAEMSKLLATGPKIQQIHPLRVHVVHFNLDMPRSIISLIQYLIMQQPTPLLTIASLRIGPLHDVALMSSAGVREILQGSQPDLDELQIKVPERYYDEHQKDLYLRKFVNSFTCKKIHTLSFELILMSPPPDAMTPYRIAMIPEMLRRVTWCRIKRLRLAFIVGVASSLSLFNWKEAAEILLEPQFLDLEEIYISVHMQPIADKAARDEMEERAEEIITEGEFGDFDDCGMLKIEFTDEIGGVYY